MKNIDIWWMNIEHPGEDGLLSDEELAQADRFARPVLRKHYVASHAGVRLILGRYLNRDPKALRFRAGPHGKPELIDGNNLHFNLTHSGNHAICAVAQGVPVGVDVQQMRPAGDIHGLAAQVFSASECGLLSGCAPDDLQALFYRLWARKEAVIKALGLGFSYPAKSVTVSPSGEVPQPVEVPGHGMWWIACIEAPPAYAASVACCEPFRVSVRTAAWPSC